MNELTVVTIVTATALSLEDMKHQLWGKHCHCSLTRLCISRHWDAPIKLDASPRGRHWRALPWIPMRSTRSAGTKRRRFDWIRFCCTWRVGSRGARICAHRKFCLSVRGTARWRVAILRVRKMVCFFSQLSPLNPRSTAWFVATKGGRARVPRCLLINPDGRARQFCRAGTSRNGGRW